MLSSFSLNLWVFFCNQKPAVHSLIEMFDKNHHVSTPFPLLQTLNAKRVVVGEQIPLINRNVTKLLTQYGSGAGMTATLVEFVTRSGIPGQIELDQVWLETLAAGMERQQVRRVKLPKFSDIQTEGHLLGMEFFAIPSLVLSLVLQIRTELSQGV